MTWSLQPHLTSVHCVMGVDPGMGGALAFYFPQERGRIDLADVPVKDRLVDVESLAFLIRAMKPTLAVIERGGSPPSGTAFSAGVAYGALHATLSLLKIRTHIVSPITWKSHFSLSADKELSLSLARQFWPSAATCFSRQRDHNRAEAALIALYGAKVVFAPAKRRKSVPKNDAQAIIRMPDGTLEIRP